MLVRLYVLADKLEDLKSANMIMDRLLDFNNESVVLIPLDTITSWVYEHTPSRSRLRTLLRDICIYEPGLDFLDTRGEEELPYELLSEITREHRRLTKVNLSKEISKVYPERILIKFSKCHYHQHKDGQPPCE